ncbi:hypothetical protein DQ392_15760 [Streptomyces reniochalinae]|uniref:Uncharacterized protein n=1 Tax=Streptomyces reniochalinae TaxID=2250578 RepID=A0A367EJ63_9ACTN|nr:hypothetical protein DQ392_15760 [Streptomyces reniochalinae]
MDEGRGRTGGDRRPAALAKDVLSALALVVGVVLGVGSWRRYLAQSAAPEGGEAGPAPGLAPVGPRHASEPTAAPVTPAHCSGARRPAGVRQRAAAPGRSAVSV